MARICAPLVMAAILPVVALSGSSAQAAVLEPRFAAYEDHPVGAWPMSVVVGDFTGDGRNDAVASSFSFSPDDRLYHFRLSLLEQSAAGALRPPVHYDTDGLQGDAGMGGLASGDLNGDGRADVALATGSGVDVFLQDAGSLGQRRLIAGPSGRQVEIADLDADGDNDLVVNGESGVVVLRGHGDATFEPPVAVSARLQVEVEVGDVTGDSRLDIVGITDREADLFRTRLHVHRQLADGTFAPSADYEGVAANGLALGDVTGDGRIDVTLASGSNDADSGMLVLPQRLNGTLGPIVAFDTARNPQPLVAADVNADGLDDLVTLHGGWSAGVHTQERDGTLSPERLFGIPNHGSYNRKGLVVGDVSSDGRPDIVFVGGTGVLVLRGEAPAPPTTATTSTSTTFAPPTTTTTAPPPPPPRIEPPDQSTSFQIDPEHSGTLTGGAERPPLAKRWSRDLGSDLSFPVIAAGRVFALARTPFSRGSTLYAIEGASGSDAWGPVDLGGDATFGYGDGHVFTLNPDGILRSFNGADGRQRWIVRVARHTGFDLPPVYRNGVVFIQGPGALFAVSADTGGILWKQDVGNVGSPPTVSDDLVYSAATCQPVTARSTRTGQRVWHYSDVCPGSWGDRTPVVAGGLLWVRGIGGRPPTAMDPATGRRVVTFTSSSPPAVDGSRGFYLTDNVLEARDVLTQMPAWQFTGDGQLVTAPIVVNGYVYVGSATGHVWAIDAATGQVAWDDDAGAPILAPEDYFRPLSSLGAGQGLVVVPATTLLVAYAPVGTTPAPARRVPAPPPPAPATGTPAQPLSDPPVGFRLDAANRAQLVGDTEQPPLRKRWSADLGAPVRYAVAAESKVFAVAANTLHALDATTGESVWGPVTLGGGPLGPSSVAYGDGRVFASGGYGPVRAFDATTGEELWTKGSDGSNTAPFTTPVVYRAGLVYAGTTSGGLLALSASSGRQVWGRYVSGGGASPAAAGNLAFGAGPCDAAYAFDGPTRAQRWADGDTCSGGGSSTIAVDDGKLWASVDGRTPVILDALTGALAGAYGGALPAFDGGRSFVLDGSALKARDGGQFTRWTFTGDGGLSTPPIVVDGYVYVGSASGRVWALDRTTGSVVWEDDAGGRIGRAVGPFPSASRGLVLVPATSLVAYEPVTPPPPLPPDRSYAWGMNALHQLGDGTTVDRRTPTEVRGVTDVVEVAGGAYHNLVRRADGTVWAWGWNGLGQLGNATTTELSAPVQVPGLTDVVSIATGAFHSLAVKRDGTVWTWGWNGLGQLGDGTITDHLSPTQVPSLAGVSSVSAGLYHSAALKQDGTVWSWGWNGLGQLGDGTTTDRRQPVRVTGLGDAGDLAAGGLHTVAVKADGTVWSWGWNGLGQLGDGTTIDRRAPRAVPGVAHVATVAAGTYHSLAVRDDGSVWSWGWNHFGQLGDGSRVDRRVPVIVPGLWGVTTVAAGFFHSLARRADGTVVGWGLNGSGQVGDGTTTDRLSPVALPGVGAVDAVAGAAFHSLVS